MIGKALLLPSSKLGVSFSPAGLLSPFHFGVVKQLKECGIIHDKTALAGSSGGALAAISAGFSVPSEELLHLSGHMAKRCRDEGARYVLKAALEEALETALPEDIADILRKRQAPCYVAYTEVNPFIKAQHVCDFTDKNDVIDVLRASCNVPYFFDGNKARIPVRGSYGIDGFFSTKLCRFGCPPTHATNVEILVTPYSAKLIGLAPENARPVGNTCTYSLISPDLLTPKDWPFRLTQLLQMSLNAPRAKLGGGKITDTELAATYMQLFQAGQEAVRVWENANPALLSGVER